MWPCSCCSCCQVSKRASQHGTGRWSTDRVWKGKRIVSKQQRFWSSKQAAMRWIDRRSCVNRYKQKRFLATRKKMLGCWTHQMIQGWKAILIQVPQNKQHLLKLKCRWKRAGHQERTGICAIIESGKSSQRWNRIQLEGRISECERILYSDIQQRLYFSFCFQNQRGWSECNEFEGTPVSSWNPRLIKGFC